MVHPGVWVICLVLVGVTIQNTDITAVTTAADDSIRLDGVFGKLPYGSLLDIPPLVQRQTNERDNYRLNAARA